MATKPWGCGKMMDAPLRVDVLPDRLYPPSARVGFILKSEGRLGLRRGTTAKRWFISGDVQGVGFRYFVQHKATALGVTGWARNLGDGRVEVYAAGSPDALNELAAALHMGPRAADVRGVEEREESVETLSGFSIR